MNKEDIEKYLQQELLSFDTKFYEQIIKNKKRYIDNEDEINANYYWCLEYIYVVKKFYIDTYNLIIESKYDEAWNKLERIEIFLQNLYNNMSEINFNKFGLDFIRNNVLSLQKLFPYRLFLSRESVITEEKCSICDKIINLRNRCNHKVGKLYMGELCYRIVTKMDLKGVAIVENPEDKYALLKVPGKQYNYHDLEQLKKHLQGPYDGLNVTTTMVKNPQFLKLGRNDICLCGSGKKYKYCCMGTKAELIRHNKIYISHPVMSEE